MNELAELVYQVSSTQASLDVDSLKLILDQVHHFSAVEVQAILALIDSVGAVEHIHRAQHLLQILGAGSDWHCFPPLDPCPL